MDAANRVLPPLKVCIGMSSDVLQQALQARFRAAGGFMVVEQPTDAESTVTALQAGSADVAILDQLLPPSGVWPVLAMVQRQPAWPPVVVLGDSDGVEPMLRALRAGARGWITASQTLDEVAECARAVAEGRIVVPAELAVQMLPGLLKADGKAETGRQLLETLTPRECAVLGLLVEGRRSRDIAVIFGISGETVRTHINRILRKLQVHSRTAAVALVLQGGFEDALRQRVG